MSTETDLGADGTGTPEAPVRLTVSLSGGGYRATAFAAGAMLAVADSALRTEVASVSSVSGGSITSAVTVGGFADPSEDDPDPMWRRVRLLAGLTQTKAISTEDLLYRALAIPLVIGFVGVSLFLVPTWRSLDDPTFPTSILFAFLGGGYLAVTAFPHSWYAVQSAVETLVSEARRTSETRQGAALADITQDETTRRIFCTTDLNSGSHVYLTPGHVLGPGEAGREPNVFLADVVAASACFPGLRPIVFRRAEVGLSASPSAKRPRRHRSGGRLLVGIAGMIGIAVAVAALVVRILGPLDGGLADLCVAVTLLASGGAVAMLSARILWLRDDLVLVDGGVCDNLGAAFALLSKDDRYPDLPIIAGADAPGLMLVVDASKPFSALNADQRGLGELIPLRLRGAQRSVLKLLGNANSVARKQVIELLLGSGGPTTGAVVSIGDVPGPSDGLDWPVVVERTKETRTTLDALNVETVRDLLLQSYRLTQSALAAHGVALTRVRSGNEFNALVQAPVPAEITKALRDAKGPYARQAVRVRRISQAVHVLLSAVVVCGIGWWYLLR